MVSMVRWKSAPTLSILLTKQMRGTLYRSAWRHTVSDWASDIDGGLFLLAPDFAAVPECFDGIDNDGDGLVDYPEDPGCRNKLAHSREDPECQDLMDNDGDTFVDGADPECAASPSWWNDESMAQPPPPNCGLGVELAPVILALALAGRRFRHA